MEKKLYILLTVMALAIALNSCKTTSVQKSGCAGPVPTYTADIKPIIDPACGTRCHSAEHHAGDINLSDYAGVKDAAENSQLLGAVRHDAGLTPMPKMGPQLPDSSIQKIQCWILNGMQE